MIYLYSLSRIKIGRTDILRLLPKSILGEIFCRDRACPCPNPNADSHKGCPYVNDSRLNMAFSRVEQQPLPVCFLKKTNGKTNSLSNKLKGAIPKLGLEMDNGFNPLKVDKPL